MRHKSLNFLETHPFLDCPFHSHQSGTVLYLKEFTDSPNPAISEMINVIHRTLGVLECDQRLCCQEDVFFFQGADMDRHVLLKAHIHFHAPHPRKIIVGGIEKELIAKILRHLYSGRIAGSQFPVDLDDGFFQIVDLVELETLPNRFACRHVINKQKFNGRNAGRHYAVKHFRVQRLVDFGYLFSCFRIYYRARQDLSHERGRVDRNHLDSCLFKAPDRTFCKLVSLFYDDFPCFRVLYIL